MTVCLLAQQNPAPTAWLPFGKIIKNMLPLEPAVKNKASGKLMGAYLFYKEKISLPHFADILRCQLLSRYGGFWFDATLFCTQTDFIPRHKDLNYFSCKQSVCSHFTQGLWSTWCCASGKDNPLFAFLYEMFILYFNRYDTILDYIQFDYTWMYAYVKFEWVAEMIDDLRYTSTNATVLIDNFGKMYNQLFFEHIMKTNLFLKLNWKKIPVPINENTLLDRFMHL